MAMALVTSGAYKPRKLRGNNFLLVRFRITPSGSYSTGGDSLDLSSLAINSKKEPNLVWIMGTGAGHQYTYDLANKKVLVFGNTPGGSNQGLAQHTAATYDTTVTNDTIEGLALFV